MEEDAEALFREIDAIGGVVKGIESGWVQRQIHQSAMRFQHEVEQKRRIVVGVNAFMDETHADDLEILRVSDAPERLQRERLAKLRTTRDEVAVERHLTALREAAARDENVMPAMLDCARAYCTLFEIRHAMEEVFGAYREPAFF